MYVCTASGLSSLLGVVSYNTCMYPIYYLHAVYTWSWFDRFSCTCNSDTFFYLLTLTFFYLVENLIQCRLCLTKKTLTDCKLANLKHRTGELDPPNNVLSYMYRTTSFSCSEEDQMSRAHALPFVIHPG